MKYICLSDFHLSSAPTRSRTDDMLKVSIKKLKFIFRMATCSTNFEDDMPILQGGDFTDKPRDFVLLYALIKLFWKYHPAFFLVKGQHDHYLRTNKPSIVSILQKLGYVTLLGSKHYTIGGKDVLWGSGHLEEIPKPEKNYLGKNILVCHKNVAKTKVYPKHKFNTPYKLIKDNPGYNLILCGDIHQIFFECYHNKFCLNTGPIVRRSIDECNKPPVYFVYDSEKNIVNKGRFPFDDSGWKFEESIRETNLAKLVDEFSNAVRSDNIQEVDAITILDILIKKNEKKINKYTMKAIDEIRKDNE